MTSVDLAAKIPNNVDLAGDRRLQREPRGAGERGREVAHEDLVCPGADGQAGGSGPCG